MEKFQQPEVAATTAISGVAKSASSQSNSAPAQSGAAPAEKPKRTAGLWAYDTLLYPLLNNFVVFGVSVAATYLTAKGGERNAAGALKYGKIGEWFQKRGDWMVRQFKKTGMNDASADMAKMVFFSFADGSVMAPVIKVLEDNRENFAKGLDGLMGTKPDDESVYQAEPKQTWLSVLGGRAVTAGIVVPTAVLLDKTGFNAKMFNNPGIRLGEWVQKRPNLAKHFGSLDIRELGRVSIFEAFYTSVCTAGLYVNSRLLAPKPKEPKALPVPPAPSTSTALNDDAQNALSPATQANAQPKTSVANYSLEGRMQSALEPSTSLG